jgi:hypothetical protein
MGSLRKAAQEGYFTPRACAQMGWPASPEELSQATHFTRMVNCYSDLCIPDEDGKRVCLSFVNLL